jgi:hypothetical protein
MGSLLYIMCSLFMSEGKRSPGRPRRRWDHNIKMDVRETGIHGANWIQLAEETVQWRDFVSTARKQVTVCQA